VVKVFFRIDGEVEVVSAEPGESVMQVATRKGIPRVIGECGGEMSCATCHVWNDDPQGFRPPSIEEDELLELADDRADNSRLSCQLLLAEGMTEVRVTVP
jgi:2Fe-2S ferredoxin